MPATKKQSEPAFNPSSIAALSSTVIASNAGFSQLEKRAAARAILRYNIHIDDGPGTHHGGVDSRYHDLHGKGNAKGVELEEIKAVTNETFRDVLDAASVLDVVDGGISLVLHCPGYQPKAAIAPENLTIDVYVTPRELAEGGEKFSELVALIVQDFGTNLAVPHLLRFQNRCMTTGVKPPAAPASGKSILVEGPSHLPRESTIGSGHIRCRCRPEGRSALAQAMAIHKLGFSQASLTLPPFPLDSTAAAVNDDNIGNTTKYPGLGVSTNIADSFGGALISLGPQTDALLERFHLHDSVVPLLRGLTQTSRSSRWEEILRTQWGLTFEQASKIAKALESDITGRAIQAELRPQPHPGSSTRSWVLSLIIVFLALVLFYLTV